MASQPLSTNLYKPYSPAQNMFDPANTFGYMNPASPYYGVFHPGGVSEPVSTTDSIILGSVMLFALLFAIGTLYLIQRKR
jgi:hypothetical protein